MEDDDIFICDKFEECRDCLNKFNEVICDNCDWGEYFESEEETETLDVIFGT